MSQQDEIESMGGKLIDPDILRPAVEVRREPSSTGQGWRRACAPASIASFKPPNG
jgi:hypothetical protein